MRSRNDWPGSWVTSTTMRSESTRVPPVTALRSPPDSRMTGADSPVIADSSTEAMPSTTVPSPGMTSPASTTTTSPRRRSAAGDGRPVREPCGRRRAHRPQRVGLGLAAALGERLGEVGEDDGQPQPDRDGEREPRGLAAAAQRAAAEELDQPGDGRDDGADLDHEHDRVADLHAGVELAQRARRPPGAGCSVGAKSGREEAVIGTWSRARLSSVTLTPGSPRTPRARPSVWSSTSARTRASGSRRTRATRLAWMRALASEMWGSTPEAESSPRRSARAAR